MSQITTHILDISQGKPARGVSVQLERSLEQKWEEIGSGVTDQDGRITNLLNPSDSIPVGTYRLIFETANYFQSQNVESFYPMISIVFEIKDSSHYHVPLLLSPYGYSTYRGS